MAIRRHKALTSGLVEIDDDGEVLEMTAAAANWIGWKRGDIVSQRILDTLLDGHDRLVVEGTGGRDIVLRAFSALKSGGWLLAIDGSEHPPAIDSSMLFEVDLTYRAVFEQAPIGIVHLDSDGYVLFENHALRQIFGEGPESAWIGRSVFEIGAIGPYLAPLVEGLLKNGRDFDARESILTDICSAEKSWLRISGTPIRNMDGDIAGGVMTFQDVSDLKKAEAVLERDRRRVEADNRMKTELIATLSHELRTPVGTIRGYAEMLDDELAAVDVSNDRAREFAQVVRERACDLEGLVSDMVEFAHLESGLLRVHLQDTSVNEIVRGVTERVTANYVNPVDVRITVDSTAVCRADPGRLRSVLLRVVDNAVKFTPAGHVAITVSENSDVVRIRVEDTGIGMDPDYVARVFDPFSQADPVLSRQFEGAGLGLAIARRVVEHMGGSIAVASAPGRGTTVTVELPSSGPA